jgi:hypothetical protein
MLATGLLDYNPRGPSAGRSHGRPRGATKPVAEELHFLVEPGPSSRGAARAANTISVRSHR